MDELFSITPQLSPRLEWIKRHRVQTRHCPEYTGDDEDETGRVIYPWYAEQRPGPAVDWNDGQGMTEDDAIADLARRMGWRLWNEEVCCRCNQRVDPAAMQPNAKGAVVYHRTCFRASVKELSAIVENTLANS